MTMPMNLPAPAGDHPDFVKFDAVGQSHIVRVDEVWDFMSKPFPNNPAPPSQVFAISGPTPAGVPASISMGGPGSRFSLYRQFYAAVNEGRLPIGSWVNVTLTGFEGQAKIFDLKIAPAGSIPDPTPPPTAVAPAPAAGPFDAGQQNQQTAAPQAEAPFGAGQPASPWATDTTTQVSTAGPWG